MPERLSRYRFPRPSRALALETVAVVAAFTGVAVFATWPLAIHPLGGFYGFGNDNMGGIPYLGWLHDANLGRGDPSFDPELQAPFGLEIPEHAVQPMDRLFSLLLGGFAQGLGTYNAQIFSSFVLAGCTMYMLARYVTGSPLAALIAGFAFTFSPFHLALAMQYNALASIQWVPLYLLALLVVLRRGRRRDAVFTGAAFALVALTSYYYVWFIGWFTLLVVGYFVVATTLRRRREGRAVRAAMGPFIRLVLSRTAIAALVAVAIAAPLLIPSAQGAAEAGSAAIEHPINEAVRYSARPWMFLIPPHDNPLVGDRVRPWLEQHLYDSPIYEQSIYLGYTALALAAFGLWRGRRRASIDLPEMALFSRGLLAAGVAAGVLIMIGPYIPFDRDYWRLWPNPAETAHMPSLAWLMFQLAPVFRFFTRAFVLVSACMSLLAAIGFVRLERTLRLPAPARIGLASLALALIGVEYTNAPPHVWFSATPPPWVKAVRTLPAGSTVVDYPIAPMFSPRSLYYMFWQSKHRRKTTNPQVTPEAQALAATIGAPDDPATGDALHRAGIDYVIVHTRLPPETTVPYQPGLPDDSMPRGSGAINPWLSVVARTSDAVIYRVLTAPRRLSAAVVRPAGGFGAREQEGRNGAWWLDRPTGTLMLFLAGRTRPVNLVLTMSSFARSRRVTLELDGRSLTSFDIPPGYLTRIVPLGSLSAGRHAMKLTARPGPQSIRATTGSLDPRSVSIRLREPVLIVPSRRR